MKTQHKVKNQSRPKRSDQIPAYTTVMAVMENYCHENNVTSSRKDKRQIGKSIKMAFKSSQYTLKDLVYFTQFEKHQNTSKIYRVNGYPLAFEPTMKKIIEKHYKGKLAGTQ